MKILIGTPAHGGMVCLSYHETILRLLAFFGDEYPGIKFVNRSIVSSVLPLARNIFASMTLNDASFSHLLFIDSDMGFAPSLIAKMIALQKPIVGCICPKKKFNYDWFHASALTYDNPMVARLLANDYIGGQGAVIAETGPDGERKAQLADGFVKVSYAGTGIMLIERQVFCSIKQRFPELWVEDPGESYRSFGLQGGVLQCFDSVQGPDGLFPGEDIAFCRRWVEGCGGEIWSSVDEAIVHVGQENFIGQYLLKLERGEALAPKPVATPILPFTPRAPDRPADPALTVRQAQPLGAGSR
jgi:hypothetical protein